MYLRGVPSAEQLDEKLNALAEEVSALRAERDEYKRQYVAMAEAYRRLEMGLTRHQRERYADGAEQTTLSLLSMLTGQGEVKALAPAPATTKVEAHQRVKPTGRKPIPDALPRITVEVLPLEVQKAGLDAFDRIGEDVSETVEKRPASVVVVRTVRGKYVEKTKLDALKEWESTPVLQGAPLELPIPKALAGPGLLADTIVQRWQDHLPLYRLERIYGREGFPLARSTVCGWHQAVAALVDGLVDAMWRDAILTAPYLCTDATGVLVQEVEKCRHGHFFVVVAPGKHVLFRYSPTHDGKAVDGFLEGYKGYLVADAHSVYEHLYTQGDVVEVACWAHARRYFYKSLETDGARSRHALALIQSLFEFEREWKGESPDARLSLRRVKAAPIVEAFFRWADEESLKVLDETPISKAVRYARNQRDALHRFLGNGRLPLHNNTSENALRREALGRKNWLFLGSDDGGKVNATLVTLLASCELHGLEPRAYLRDLLCLLPAWNQLRVLELAPENWAATVANPDVQHQLDGNIFRQATLGVLKPGEPPAAAS